MLLPRRGGGVALGECSGGGGARAGRRLKDAVRTQQLVPEPVERRLKDGRKGLADPLAERVCLGRRLVDTKVEDIVAQPVDRLVGELGQLEGAGELVARDVRALPLGADLEVVDSEKPCVSD